MIPVTLLSDSFIGITRLASPFLCEHFFQRLDDRYGASLSRKSDCRERIFRSGICRQGADGEVSAKNCRPQLLQSYPIAAVVALP